MAVSKSSIDNLIVALADAKAGKELAAAIASGAKLSSYTFERLVIAMGNRKVAQNFQDSIMGLKALSASDLKVMTVGFSSPTVAANVASNVLGGLAPDAIKALPGIVIVPAVVATPTFSPVAGSYGPTQSVTISSVTSGATIYYTTNGSTPTTSSTLYSGPVSVSVSSTLKALAVKAAHTDSAIGSAAYVINGAVATPTFSPVAGSYGGTQSVTISSTTAGATFYYTTNGSTPTTASTLYTGPVSVAVSETLKALGVKAGFSNSAIGSAAYVIGGLGPSAVNLLTAGNYRILTEAGISTTAGSAITGDIAVSPIAATAITGFGLVLDGGGTFSTSALVTGQVFAADYAPPTPATLTQAISDKNTAYTDAAGRTSPDYTNLGSGEIGSLTLTAGLYKWTTGVTISNNVTISGGPSDVFIFQIAGTLNLSNTKSIILSGGVLPQNIFWQVSGAVTIGVSSTFRGIVLGATNIAVQTTATVHGRLYAGTAVTLDQDVVAS